MEIKQQLVDLRKQMHFTQKQIAQMLGMSETGYASWEQGLAEPNIAAIKKICRIYNISADELLGMDQEGTV